jgi:hypothetical protein
MSADKLGPIEIEFLLDKQADEQAKKLKGSLDDVGASVRKNTTNFKQEIQSQKDFIKGLTAEIKEMQKAFDNATAGSKKNNIGTELGQAKRRLAEAQSDLIRLQREQIEVNSAEGKSVESLSANISKWALSLGGAAYFLGLLKKALLETTGGLNAFNVLGAITQQMLYNIASGAMSFSDNIMGAIEVQKKFNALRTEEYVDSVKSAKLNNEYQQLYAESLDATLSRADKIATIDKALKAHNDSIDIQQEHVRKSIEATDEALMNQPGSEKYLKQLSALYVELENLEAERFQSTKRLVRQRSILIKEGIDEEIKWREDLHKNLQKLADEQIEINNSIAEQEKLFQKAAEDGNTAEVIRIKNRIDVLQKELDIRINIAKAAILADAGGVIPIITHLPGVPVLSTRPTSTLAGAPVTSEISKYIPGTAMLTDEAMAKQKKNREKGEKDDLEYDEKKKKNQKEILEAATQLTLELAQQVGLSEEDQKIMGSMLNTFTQLATGNYIGAAFSLLSGLISLIPNEAEKFQSQIDAINKSLEDYNRLVDESQRHGGLVPNLELQLENAKKRLAELWELYGQTNVNDKKRQKELLDQIRDLTLEIPKYEQELKDALAGGITENSIADAIAQGFQDGKTSVDDFASYMNDVLKNAIVEIFKQQILSSPAMEAYIDYIREALSDKVLTPEEKAKIDQMGADMAADMKPYWDAMNQGLYSGEQTVANNTSLQGSIKGITEETASVLAGQMNAIRINVADTSSIMRQQLLHMAEIAANTRYNKHLESIDNKLDALKDNSLRPQGIA